RWSPGRLAAPSPKCLQGRSSSSLLLGSLYIRKNPQALDTIRIFDRAVAIGIALLDGVHSLHAAQHLAPDGILSVEVRRAAQHDEELAVGTVRVLRASHSHYAALKVASRELRRQVGKIRTSHPGTCRIPSLSHEAVDNPVEDNPVVEAVPGEGANTLDMLRCQFWQHLDLHGAVRQLHDQDVLRIGLRHGLGAQAEEEKSRGGGRNQPTHGQLIAFWRFSSSLSRNWLVVIQV